MPETETAAVIRELWPLLDVSDINRSVAFYRDQLGFAIVADDAEPGGQMGWCRLVRSGASIMLQGPAEQSEVRSELRGRGVCFYFVCDDADAMYRELSSRGMQLEAPKIAYYGMKQLYLADPDGYAICFESPVSEP
jgi:predicted enzyme related to lactoylglutathione lyase